MAVFDLQRLAQDRVGPVDVIEPLAGRRSREQVRADLGEQVARHGQPGGFGERSRAQPAGDAADLSRVGHAEIGRAGREAFRHVVRPPPVLADLDRNPALRADLRVAGEIVGKRRLLHPREALARERLDAVQRFGHRQRLVVVGRQLHARADRTPDCAHDLDIGIRIGVSEPDFDGIESDRELLGFEGGALGADDSEPATVVRRDRPRFGADKSHQRQALCARQRVPRGHVDPCHRHADEALRAGQPELVLQLALEVERRDRIALDQRHKVREQLRHRLECWRRVAEEIGAPGDALLGLEVEQRQRRDRDRAAARRERQPHRHVDRAHVQVADRQRRMSGHWNSFRSAQPGI
jgi:hypothetical protein